MYIQRVGSEGKHIKIHRAALCENKLRRQLFLESWLLIYFVSGSNDEWFLNYRKKVAVSVAVRLTDELRNRNATSHRTRQKAFVSVYPADGKLFYVVVATCLTNVYRFAIWSTRPMPLTLNRELHVFVRLTFDSLTPGTNCYRWIDELIFVHGTNDIRLPCSENNHTYMADKPCMHPITCPPIVMCRQGC